jgi:hypothetical protein
LIIGTECTSVIPSQHGRKYYLDHAPFSVSPTACTLSEVQ